MLQWLQQHSFENVTRGAEEGMRSVPRCSGFTSAAVNLESDVAGAARNGDLDVLRWLHQQRSCSEECSTAARDTAVSGGHLGVGNGCLRAAAQAA
jgi:hypothetical protein